jgi:predicted nucleic acid-binding protein
LGGAASATDRYRGLLDAATALAYGLELVTHNPTDFANIPGLVVITEAP